MGISKVKVRVLGCHGGELPSCKTTCFLIDDLLAVDAGALTASLPLERLTELDHIILSHSHFDHVKDLPLLADLMVGRRRKPIVVHASRECARTLQKSMFNDSLWPDFTKIPNRRRPIIQFKPFRAGSTFTVGRYKVRTIAVSHPVESCGFVITKDGCSVAFSGDTGPTEGLWRVLNEVKNLRALILETSFPNKLQPLADISGHLTPQTLRRELRKFRRNGAEVLLYHLKPAYLTVLKEEVSDLPVEVLEVGDLFEF